MSPTPEQLRKLAHMLGVDNQLYRRHPNCYRNRYTVGDSKQARMELDDMVVAGYVDRVSADGYAATALGKELAVAWFYRRRHGKAKRVYRVYLGVRDITPISFFEFLKDPIYRAVRREA